MSSLCPWHVTLSYHIRIRVNPIVCLFRGHIPTELTRCHIAAYHGGPDPGIPATRFIGCARQGCRWEQP